MSENFKDYTKDEIADSKNITESVKKSLENSILTSEEKQGILVSLDKNKNEILNFSKQELALLNRELNNNSFNLNSKEGLESAIKLNLINNIIIDCEKIDGYSDVIKSETFNNSKIMLFNELIDSDFNFTSKDIKEYVYGLLAGVDIKDLISRIKLVKNTNKLIECSKKLSSCEKELELLKDRLIEKTKKYPWMLQSISSMDFDKNKQNIPEYSEIKKLVQEINDKQKEYDKLKNTENADLLNYKKSLFENIINAEKNSVTLDKEIYINFIQNYLDLSIEERNEILKYFKEKNKENYFDNFFNKAKDIYKNQSQTHKSIIESNLENNKKSSFTELKKLNTELSSYNSKDLDIYQAILNDGKNSGIAKIETDFNVQDYFNSLKTEEKKILYYSLCENNYVILKKIDGYSESESKYKFKNYWDNTPSVRDMYGKENLAKTFNKLDLVGLKLSINFKYEKQKDGSIKYECKNIDCNSKDILIPDGKNFNGFTKKENKTFFQEDIIKFGKYNALQDNTNLFIKNDIDIKNISNGILKIGGDVNELYTLFQSGLEGSMTDDYVKLVREKANILDRKSWDLLKNIDLGVKKLQEIKKSLGNGGIYKTPEEKIIQEKIDSLLGFVENIKSQGFKDMISTINNPAKFNEKTIKSWLIKDGIPMLGAIAGGVALVIAAAPTGGTSLLAISAIGSLGGIFGSEVGNIISSGVGKMKYGKDYENNSFLVDNLIKGRSGGKIDWEKLFSVYGQQFIMGTLMTFSIMGIAKHIAGPFLGKLLTSVNLKDGASKK